MEYEHVIQLPLPGGSEWYAVCPCEDAEKAAAVVRAILDCGPEPPPELRVITRPILDRMV